MTPTATWAGLKCRSAAASCRNRGVLSFLSKHGKHKAVKRRDFITMLGGAAAVWPLAARAQQRGGMRRLGVFIDYPAEHPEGQVRNAAFLQGLAELGWTDCRNV